MVQQNQPPLKRAHVVNANGRLFENLRAKMKGVGS
jgi:hypothetical protein